eukprot:CAMPEP_0119384114 /NCGR_PEP_ID=MMETSP1334-20130426/83743_1 /TAXON_ID=127549 /ORGANISM="Calcidiscus leptoporus, Strain RCC1130" /LENGTH=32 /DNA_ID= /DNA_START= /DNA_END= /DNA_ORIENTATION=
MTSGRQHASEAASRRKRLHTQQQAPNVDTLRS